MRAGVCTAGHFSGGTLSCNNTTCGLVTTGCYRCGDLDKNGSEVCDGTARHRMDDGDETPLLQKPFTSGALARMVRNVLDRQPS